MPVSVSFDPRAASPEERLAVGELLCACHASAHPEDPPHRPEREAQGLLPAQPNRQSWHWVTWEGPRALAHAQLSGSLTENRGVAYARVLVHPEARRRGLGQQLAQAVQAHAAEQGRTTLLCSTTSLVPAGAAFARALDARTVQERRQSQLLLDEVDEGLLQRWTESAQTPTYRLHHWERAVPENYVERYAELLGVINDAPKGDIDLEDETYTPAHIRAWEKEIAEQGERLFMLVVEDVRSGELVGLTETVWSPERPSLVYQMATAVRANARGQGLGQWLKAAMLLHLRGRAPGARFVRTGNAEGNAAMLAINTALGFRPWAAVTQWKWASSPEASA
ncbi:L-amino acid N-acyltransferase YncA [Deinococcus reticulitermitis]|uniref:L-amino acid N-acyltransferase YncA n=1 Tax=Deinococcus reticulitermitis TaxID=856736 RepID=A0A1H6X9N8_9DEIO|nr:GNAT family N-acetyltransferase [Deinococcus reticulitermitis]SEJ24826.1 L-amino acid N-acyltransferase YncA [Deinococcus reticulitermitis]